MFRLSGIQVVEPSALGKSDTVIVEFDGEKDIQGFDRADIVAAKRSDIVSYVRAHWGDDDKNWFDEFVVDGIVEAPISFDEYRETAAPKPAVWDGIEVFDSTSERWYAAVEEAWYDEAKGELWLSKGEDANNPEDVDDELRNTVTNLGLLITEFVRTSAQGQTDAKGDDIEVVTIAEAARRVAVALNVCWYGGR